MSWKNSLALAGQSFKPTDIPGLQNWWHAGFENTVTLVGNRVSEWRDLLRGVPASTVTAGTRPEYVRNAQNGKNALFFNQSELLVSDANRPAASRHTIVAALRPSGVFAGDSAPFSINLLATLHGAGLLWFVTTNNSYLTPSTGIGTAMCTVGYTNAADRVSLYKDGVHLTAGQVNAAVSTSPGMLIGRRRQVTSGFFPGYICELLYFTRDLTRPEMAQLQTYFDREWQITGAGLAVDAVSSPLDIPNCQLWLDASDLSTLKQNADGTGTVSRIGDPVGYWGNKGPQAAWNATETISQYKPVLAEGMPGKKALLFSGGQSLFAPGVNAGSAATAVAVFVSYPTTGSSARIFDTGSRQALFVSSGSLRIGNGSEQWGGLSGERSVGQVNIAAVRYDRANTASVVNGFVNYHGPLGSNSFSGGMGIGWANWTPRAESSSHNGLICELAVFDRPLSAVELRQLTRYLQDKWGSGIVRPVAGHPEAQAWIDRVYLNGGFVSQYTADRVSQFCYRIDQAGLRDRFHRLNLFCGGNLAAALTPLYLGPSAAVRSSGFVYESSGNFSATHYAELGGFGGLKGNGSNTASDTGFRVTSLNELAPNVHISHYCNQLPITADTLFIYTGFSVGQLYYALNFGVGTGTNSRDSIGGATGAGFFISGAPGHRLITRDGTGVSLYKNAVLAGTQLGTLTSADYPPGGTQTIRLFAGRTNDNAANGITNARMQGYSLGASMNATQVASYREIMEEFQRSLGRGVDIYANQFPEITHPDALDWLTRVHGNGGVVDATTAGYVQDVCNAIDAAGLRDRFYRLNLFCGSNIAAALTPLYRGTSVTGTQYGTESDTQSASFLPTTEYANARGLAALTATKTLSTNVIPTALPQVQTSHIAMGVIPNSIIAGARCLGVGLSNQTFMWYGEVFTGARGFTGAATSNSASIGVSNVDAYARWCISRTSDTSHVIYRNGQSAASNSTANAARTAASTALNVFAPSGFPVGSAAMGFNFYSFGAGFTAQQATAFDSIIKQFLHVTGRVPLPPSDVLAIATNADASDWVHRVYANGGTVSTTTMQAVQDFCAAVDAAGIRNRFYRLNLFCGSNLAAARTPLYYGTAAGSFQYGAVMDAATAFVEADYVETGVSGGLQGNGSSKWLETGVLIASLGGVFPDNHLAIYGNNAPSASGGVFIQVGPTNQDNYLLAANTSATTLYHSIGGSAFTNGVSETSSTRLGMRMISRSSTTLQTLYKNGASAGTNTNAVSTAPVWSGGTIPLFGQRIQNNSPGQFSNVRACSYSMGLGMTAQQALDYYNAMQAFQTALGRQA